jgi:hypothetical protein
VVHIISTCFDIETLLEKAKAELEAATEGSGGKADEL